MNSRSSLINTFIHAFRHILSIIIYSKLLNIYLIFFINCNYFIMNLFVFVWLLLMPGISITMTFLLRCYLCVPNFRLSFRNLSPKELIRRSKNQYGYYFSVFRKQKLSSLGWTGRRNWEHPLLLVTDLSPKPLCIARI